MLIQKKIIDDVLIKKLGKIKYGQKEEETYQKIDLTLKLEIPDKPKNLLSRIIETSKKE
jgi:hypothetical protein